LPVGLRKPSGIDFDGFTSCSGFPCQVFGSKALSLIFSTPAEAKPFALREIPLFKRDRTAFFFFSLYPGPVTQLIIFPWTFLSYAQSGGFSDLSDGRRRSAFLSEDTTAFLFHLSPDLLRYLHPLCYVFFPLLNYPFFFSCFSSLSLGFFAAFAGFPTRSSSPVFPPLPLEHFPFEESLFILSAAPQTSPAPPRSSV